MTIRQRRVVTAAALDVASLLLFVVIGRRNHEEGESVAGIVETAAPFLIGLAVAWLVVRAWRWPTALLTGLALWPITVLIGMLCRSLLFGDGTAASFVIVATLFIGICLVGWRAAARAILRRRQNSTATAGTS
jgi:MFS-type transporter involved in bile tolerance (Atg22 family)